MKNTMEVGPSIDELDEARSTAIYRFLLKATYVLLVICVFIIFFLLSARVYGEEFAFIAKTIQFMLLIGAIPQLVVQSILLRDVIWLIERNNAKERESQQTNDLELITSKVYTKKRIALVLVLCYVVSGILNNVIMVRFGLI